MQTIKFKSLLLILTMVATLITPQSVSFSVPAPAYDIEISGDITSDISWNGSTRTWSATSGDAVLNVEDLEGELATGNVTIRTGGSSSNSGNGNINILSPFSFDSNTLNIIADSDINLSATVDISGTAGLDVTKGGYILAEFKDPYTGGFKSSINIESTCNLAIDSAPYVIVNSLGSEGDETADSTFTLQGMAHPSNLSTNFVLGSDIDASASSIWNNEGGFVPIGYNTTSPSETTSYEGKFNGLGHTISDLTFTSSSVSNKGLFGNIHSKNVDVEISNVGLVNIKIEDSNSGSVGALVGFYLSAALDLKDVYLYNNYSTGSITSTRASQSYIGGLYGSLMNSSIINNYSTVDVVSQSYGGGIVGKISGNAEQTSVITDAFSTGSVRGKTYVGGLAGGITSMNVSSSYSDSNVTCDGNEQMSNSAGGFSGAFINATVENCYSTGSVTGYERVGGFVGSGLSATINNSFSTGKVTAQTSEVGGFSPDDDFTYNNCFWNTETAGSSDSFGGTGLTTSQMKSLSTYIDAGWDIGSSSTGSSWIIDDGSSFPYLPISAKKPGTESDSGSSSGSTSKVVINADFVSSEVKDEKLQIDLTVNGEKKLVGNEYSTYKDGIRTATLEVDSRSLSRKLDKVVTKDESGNKTVVFSVVTENPDVSVIKLDRSLLDQMADEDYQLSFKAGNITYTIPSKELSTRNISEIEGENLKLEIKISKNRSHSNDIEKILSANSQQMIIEPVNFEVITSSKSDGATLNNIENFNTYVEITFEIPSGVDMDLVTTGIQIGDDNSITHVPTVVCEIDGVNYAKINSLTNDTCAVIYNPVSIDSVENHWSKEAVNDMASRLVITNTIDFLPNESISRGKFADFLTKALGVYETSSYDENLFTDVQTSDEFADAIAKAVEYGLITGYEDGTFRANALITREQAMAMFERAMDVVELEEGTSNKTDKFDDKLEIGGWAKKSVERTINSGIFNGVSDTKISPKSNLTTAEAATAIRNLVQKASLINT